MLKKILYSAVDDSGREIQSFIEARSNQEAYDILEYKGFSKIEFHDDALHIASERIELEDLTDTQNRAIAKFEIQSRRHQSFYSFLLEVLRSNKWLIFTGLILVAWSIYNQSTVGIALGLLISLPFPAISIWNYKNVKRYNDFLAAFALGKCDKALTLLNHLKKSMTAPEMAFDLQIREACIRVKNTHVGGDILNQLQHWQDKFIASSPGLFESRLATVYFSAGDTVRFVELMRDAYAKSPNNASVILDLALAEARTGHYERAQTLLNHIDKALLPVHGRPFLHWVQGLIDANDQLPSADNQFSSAIAGFMEFNDNPAVWPSLAMNIADYANFEPHTKHDTKLKGLQKAWPIICFHAEKSLIDSLKVHYPEITSH